MIANILPSLTEKSAERLARAMATVSIVNDFSVLPDHIAKRDALLALV